MKHFLSQLHAELRRALRTKRGATLPPDKVPRGFHKTYERMPAIALPAPLSLSMTLGEALGSRTSALAGDPAIPVSIEEMGTLLGLGLSKRGGSMSRNYPSGGALYPVETYLVTAALETQSPAVYHYNPTKHCLERLWDLPAGFRMKDIAPHPESLPLSSLIVFTSVWRRSSAKYGDLAYLHALIEAGHMSENLLLVGTALGLNMRPYAGFDDTRIIDLLDLDADDEQPVHSITLCKAGA